MPRGRPPKKVASPQPLTPTINVPAKRGHPVYYNEQVCDKLIECFANGDTVAIFCARQGIAESTFYKWTHEYPALREAYEQAKTCAKAFFESHLIQQATSLEKAPNATQLMAIMNNRFKDDYSRNPNDVSRGDTTNNFLVLGHTEVTKQIAALLASEPELLELYESRESEGTFSLIEGEKADRDGEQILPDVSGDGT